MSTKVCERVVDVWVHSRDHAGWGSAFHWLSTDDGGKHWRLAGHQWPIPQDGDLIVWFGKDSWPVYRLSNVKRCDSPRDMFFADAEWVSGIQHSLLDRWVRDGQIDPLWLPERYSLAITDEQIDAEIATWRNPVSGEFFPSESRIDVTNDALAQTEGGKEQ